MPDVVITPIDAERFDDLLNVLPPYRWHCGRGVEFFHMSEYIRENTVLWVCRVNSTYLTFEGRPTMLVGEIAAVLSNYAKVAA